MLQLTMKHCKVAHPAKENAIRGEMSLQLHHRKQMIDYITEIQSIPDIRTQIASFLQPSVFPAEYLMPVNAKGGRKGARKFD